MSGLLSNLNIDKESLNKKLKAYGVTPDEAVNEAVRAGEPFGLGEAECNKRFDELRDSLEREDAVVKEYVSILEDRLDLLEEDEIE